MKCNLLLKNYAHARKQKWGVKAKHLFQANIYPLKSNQKYFKKTKNFQFTERSQKTSFNIKFVSMRQNIKIFYID